MAWSEALDVMKRKWVDSGLADSAWGPHTWPRWSREAVAEYVGKQSRLYRYIHDQTVFLMNKGYDMTEIAEIFTFPTELAKEWFNRGYYGATVFNVKAVYQKYLGWFDNNPASLWKLPGKISAALYAKYLPLSGGSLLDAAQLAYEDGQYRWVVEVLDHICLAPEAWGETVYNAASDLQADAFEQMAYAAESGIWRNYFLTGTWRNRDEEYRKLLNMQITGSMGPDTVRNMETQQILDTLSTQINGSTSASSFTGTVVWNIKDALGNIAEQYEMRMEDHVLWTLPLLAVPSALPDTTITLSRDDLNNALSQVSAQDSWLDALLRNTNVQIDGNQSLLPSIASLTHIDPPPLPTFLAGSPPRS
jgi:alkyl sulfatase BDS1-like metallo-beta-lactamase superfamily hydrolase